MDDGLSESKTAKFSMRGQRDNANNSVPAEQLIHPFLPDLTVLLKAELSGTPYESLFAGNFVDRVQLYNHTQFPNEPVWDPLNVKEYPERHKNRKIYCTLVTSINMINVLLQKECYSTKTRYHFTLFQDMFIPLANHIDFLIQKQQKQLAVISFLHKKTIKVFIPELEPFFEPVSEKKVDKILSLKSYERFDYLMKCYPDLFTDRMFCTQTDQNQAAVAVRLEPCQALFDSGHLFHDGLMPDVLRHVVNCNFFSESKKDNPLVHLISKSLPQRCTIRNLSDILRDYCQKHQYVYNFVIACMKSSLLGLYAHATTRPPFHIRKKLIDVFQTKTKNEFLQWLMRGHQQLLFYVIKEFLVFSCKLIPSLYSEIIIRYSWDKFEEGVCNAMNAVRRYEKWDPENPLLFKDVEKRLADENKCQIHNLYRPLKASFASTVISECDRLDEDKCITKSHIKIKPEWRDLMYKIAIRTTENEIPFDLLACFRVSPSTINQISNIQEIFNEDGSKQNLKSFLGGLSRHDFECVRDFCDSYDRKANIRVFMLPAHTYTRQCVALRRKHRVPTGKPLPDNVGEVMVCLNCKQFKSFVNKHDNKGKPQNLYAYGHKKVLVEYTCTEDGEEKLMTYCGRRCEKSDGKKRHNYSNTDYSSYMDISEIQLITQQNERKRKRASKEARKESLNDVCSRTPLVKINLLGRILQFYGKLYTICPSCGNPMCYNHFFNGPNGFYCGCCLSQSGELYTQISCEYCSAIKNNESWAPITILSEESTEENQDRKQIYLCNGCFKPWIQTAGLLKLSTIRRGLSEKWKKLQHPSNHQ